MAKEKHKSLFNLISKKPLVPDFHEIKQNIRSRSAKLRYAIRNNSSFFYPNEFRNKFENYLNLESNLLSAHYRLYHLCNKE